MLKTFVQNCQYPAGPHTVDFTNRENVLWQNSLRHSTRNDSVPRTLPLCSLPQAHRLFCTVTILPSHTKIAPSRKLAHRVVFDVSAQFGSGHCSLIGKTHRGRTCCPPVSDLINVTIIRQSKLMREGQGGGGGSAMLSRGVCCALPHHENQGMASLN